MPQNPYYDIESDCGYLARFSCPEYRELVRLLERSKTADLST